MSSHIYFQDEGEAITYVFRSLRKLRGQPRGLDEFTRNTAPTQQLLNHHNLLHNQREYTVVTGSKGKGSTTALTARLLQSLGHKTGMITSPHLVSYRERIRVDGKAIPVEDFIRILSQFVPTIDAIEAQLTGEQYFSPQGIFLTVALAWFDEQDVECAVLEVGRGGRFDDIAVVPNRVSVITPIMLEHPHQLGNSLERIAWHKAGIIKQHGYVYSAPQAPEVLKVLQAEATLLESDFFWFSNLDLGEYVGPTENGLKMRLGRYGELEVALLGEYQVMNVTLAVQAAGNVHGRLGGISHGSPEYIQAIKHGLAHINWPGRLQKLSDQPAVYVDGAINGTSARSLVQSLEDQDRLQDPVIGIVAVPDDKGYIDVYKEIGLISELMILTETDRNITLHFPDQATALQEAQQFNRNVVFQPNLEQAVELARQQAGTTGTILIVGTQSIVADAMQLWGLSYEQL